MLSLEIDLLTIVCASLFGGWCVSLLVLERLDGVFVMPEGSPTPHDTLTSLAANYATAAEKTAALEVARKQVADLEAAVKEAIQLAEQARTRHFEVVNQIYPSLVK